MTDTRQVISYVAGGLAMAALLVVGYFYLASGLVAPLWAVIALMIIWLGLLVTGIVWFRRHPLRVWLLPVVAVLLWVATLSAGEAWLGWTA